MTAGATRNALAGSPVQLAWDRGSALVYPLGAALHDLNLVLDDGRTVRPLAEAPWQDEAETLSDTSIPAHLRNLGGEWPCVPFGRSDADPALHGYGTDNHWRLLTATPDSCEWEIAYPPEHAIGRLSRAVAGVPGRAEVICTLVVEPRRDCVIPVGLHPILQLPEPGKTLRIEASFGHGETFPVMFEDGVSRLAEGARFSSLDALPLAVGDKIGFGDLCGMRTEEALQLLATDGELRAVYDDAGYAVRLSWDPGDFPTCLFWLSAGGRTHRPWGARFRGLGVEPLAARFVERDGQGAIVGTIVLRAGRAWTTRYTLSAASLAGGPP